jgi:PAS domain S-box-containing protein
MSRLLLVEDEAIIAMSEKGDLERFGYEVELAYSGERALEAFARGERFDAVLMDIDLGRGMDGTEAAAAILAGRDIPILFMSGHSEPEIVERTERITSYGYIVKGSSPIVIHASIRMAQRLFDAKRMFQAVLDANPQFICWKDRESAFMGCNKNHAALFGLPDTDSIVGKTDWDLHKGEDEIRGFIRDDAEVMESGVPRYRIEERAIYPDGSERLLETNKVPLRDSRGEVSGVMISYSDVTERAKDEERIRALLAEKELVLREVQHRMMNDLTMIGSMLSIQAGRAKGEEARAVLLEAGEGIRNMAVMYEKIASTQALGHVPMKIYLADFGSRALAKSPLRDTLELKVEAEDFSLPTKILRPLGMILNEILTNALKHAFVGRESGRIEIVATTRDGVARIELRDDGVGLPESVDLEKSSGFGLTMLPSLAAQLDGKISVSRGGGTAFVLEFPY